jgi:fibronectin type 3 domain-containing protein
LSWVDNTPNETHFILDRSDNGSTYRRVASLQPNTRSYTNSGLTGGTTYRYRIKAITPTGNSAWVSVDGTTLAVGSRPASPSALTASALSSSQIRLTWKDNTTNESYFILERSTDGTTYRRIASPAANAKTYTDGGLSAGTTYHYRLKALTPSGTSGWTKISRKTFAAVIPTAPSNFSATGTSSTRITLNWQDNTTTETHFIVERSIDGTSYSRIASLAANATAYADNGLASNTLYRYRIKAITPTVNSTWSQTNGTTQAAATAPSAPTNLSAGAASSSSINLQWSDTSGETSYRIERSTNGTSWTEIATVGANVTTHAANGLSAATQYFFRVRAANASGNSPYTNTANATTQSGTTIAKPDASNTGYSGSLTTVNGTYTASAGEVIQNKLFTGGIIVPAGAHNVVIRNCKITGGHYAIRCWDGAQNLLIEDVEIDGSASPGAIGSKGIIGSNFTARRVHVHHTGSDGIQTVGSNVTITQSYIHDSGYGGYNAANPVDSDHTDGIQVFGGSNIVIEYSTVVTRHGGNRSNGTSTGFPLRSQVNPWGTANSAVVLQSDSSSGGPISNWRVSNNWLDGGMYTLRVEEKDGNQITGGVITGNKFGRDYYFGSVSSTTGSPTFTSSGNMYEDNGSAVGGL